MSTLTANSFELLLKALDADEMRAADKYELLRYKLSSLLKWKGCSESDADDLVDRTLDRVATKIAEGERVENVGVYAGSVARFIWLEHSRKKKKTAVGDDLPEVAVDPDLLFLKERDTRIDCLRDCMAETIPNPTDKQIIIGYYDADSNEKNKDARKKLAETLGLSVNTMKVKACRLRDRLERCINDCVEHVTKSAISGTNKQEVMER